MRFFRPCRGRAFRPDMRRAGRNRVYARESLRRNGQLGPARGARVLWSGRISDLTGKRS